MNLAPVVIFVYNRVNTILKTLKYLKRDLLSKDSDLIIYSDGPKNYEDIIKINKVRDIIKKINGFKSLTIYESKENKGLAKSIINGVTETLKKYKKIIVLEDDLIISPYFLQYMNDALNLYENEENVISIHGFIYPVSKKLPDTFFIKGADCWGWATWQRGWDLFESDGKKLLKELEEKNLTFEFDFNGSYPYTEMLIDQINGKNNSWAIRWYASAFLRNKLTLYPGKNLVGNIGMECGTHCKTSKNITKIYKKRVKIVKIPIEENLEVKKVIIDYFDNQKKEKFEFKKFIKKMVKKILNYHF